MSAEYTLVYHAGIQGRAEFVRLYFEATGTPYIDTAKTVGQEAVAPYSGDDFEGNESNPTSFAPPVLIHNKLVLSQTASILLYLSSQLPPLDLDDEDNKEGEPKEKKKKASHPSLTGPATLHTNSFVETLFDLNDQVHDTHHPIAVMDYYADQKPSALLRAKAFRDERAPKFLNHFERVLKKSGSGWLLPEGGATYADLVLFQMIEGLLYAFPNLLARLEPTLPLTFAHHKKIAESKRIKEYLASDRRVAFNENGMFRHYPELDPKEEEVEGTEK